MQDQTREQQPIDTSDIVITATRRNEALSDVPMAVSAVKKGAAEFIEKPFNDRAFLGLVEKALTVDAAQRREQARKLTVAARLEKLTSREREIMGFVIAGKMNKTIADELCISIKTVEAHRARAQTTSKTWWTWCRSSRPAA